MTAQPILGGETWEAFKIRRDASIAKLPGSGALGVVSYGRLIVDAIDGKCHGSSYCTLAAVSSGGAMFDVSAFGSPSYIYRTNEEMIDNPPEISRMKHYYDGPGCVGWWCPERHDLPNPGCDHWAYFTRFRHRVIWLQKTDDPEYPFIGVVIKNRRMIVCQKWRDSGKHATDCSLDLRTHREVQQPEAYS